VDTFKIKHLVTDMMNEYGLTLEQARSKALDIVEVACDMLEEEAETPEWLEYEKEQEREALEYEMKKQALTEAGLAGDISTILE